MSVVRKLCFSYHLSQHQKSKPNPRPAFHWAKDESAMVTPEDAGMLPAPEDDVMDRVRENEDMISFHMVNEEDGGILSINMELLEGRRARVGMIWREKVRKKSSLQMIRRLKMKWR